MGEGEGEGDDALAVTHPARPAAAPLWSNESSSSGQAEEKKKKKGEDILESLSEAAGSKQIKTNPSYMMENKPWKQTN